MIRSIEMVLVSPTILAVFGHCENYFTTVFTNQYDRAVLTNLVQTQDLPVFLFVSDISNLTRIVYALICSRIAYFKIKLSNICKRS